MVENRGQIDAEGVLIRALVPEWADLRGQVASRGEIATRKEGLADRLVWEIGQLPAGKSETMKPQLIASRGGNYDLDIDWTLIPQKSVARVQVRNHDSTSRLRDRMKWSLENHKPTRFEF